MESLGQYLKTQRELRKVDLLSISDETKIGINWLEVIEEDKWDSLPCKTFARGFLKAYAKSLGLDSDEILLRYDAGREEDAAKEIAAKKSKGAPRKFWFLTTAILVATLIAFLAWFLT